MTFTHLMSFLIGAGGAISLFFFRKGGTYNPHEVPPEPVSPMDDESKVGYKPAFEDFCLAIRDFEGQPGDMSYRNNNPGNFRCSKVGYSSIYGTVKCSPNNFAIFRDQPTGWLYMHNAIKEIIKKHPSLTIYTFIAGERDDKDEVIPGGYPGYSPTKDNNPVDAYSAHIAKRLGVDSEFLVKNLV